MEHLFDIEIAKKYSVDAAILIRHFQFWILKNKANKKHLIDGRTWTYVSVESLTKIFPYWTRKQVRRILNELVDKRILTKGNHNEKGYDHTTWYAFLNEKRFAQMGKSIGPNGQIKLPEKAEGIARLGRPIPNTNTYKLTDKSTNPIGDIKSSQKILELDLKIAQEKKFLIFQLESIFHPNERERKTFSRVISHLVNKCQKGELHISIFKDAIEWARFAKASNAVNKKGLFIAKVKQETGFCRQERLLKSGVI